MKVRTSIISGLLVLMFFMSGCGDKAPMQNLKESAKEIEKIAEQSKNIQNKEQAFTILRDLNNEMKDVREAVLALDNKYNKMKPGSEKFKDVKQTDDFQNTMKEFEKVNERINSSMASISKNLEPYKEDEEVKKMLEKLQTLLISR
jgi:geranylgeranyl pyrophosphate synthase